MSIKAIICSDSGGAHDAQVAQSFIGEAGITIGETLNVVGSLSTAITSAISNGANIIIRSTTGIETSVTTALAQYPHILVVMPLGSNSYVELTSLTDIPVIVSTGAGIQSATQNQTGYGNGLEFWDNENVANTATAESSWSNGIIAGKLYKIKTTLNCSWWEARYKARLSTNQAWNKYNGYGRISVQRALEEKRQVIQDPFVEAEASTLGSRRCEIDVLRTELY